ncbi:MAG: hypothetical protein JW976_15655 [Syntrophaceae bacterium]|nr:hypothetical protein [Syntrophaceae bacterium]
MNILQRVDKLEERLGVNKEPETVEEMYKKLIRGEYNNSLMSLVVVIANSPNPCEDLKNSGVPMELIKYLVKLDNEFKKKKAGGRGNRQSLIK